MIAARIRCYLDRACDELASRLLANSQAAEESRIQRRHALLGFSPIGGPLNKSADYRKTELAKYAKARLNISRLRPAACLAVPYCQRGPWRRSESPRG